MGKKPRRNKKSFKKTATAIIIAERRQGPAILRSIRHADPRTRCAAITALSDGTGKKRLSTEILRAIVQQVPSNDVHCGIAAAGCLGNYLMSACDDDESSAASIDEALTAGWLIIFVARLKECLNQLTATETSSSCRLLHLELTERCLFCLVNLLENNPLAMLRLERQANDCMSLLTKLLQTSTGFLQRDDANTTASSANNELWQSIQILSARCLHSVWDDNAAVLVPYLLSSESCSAKETLQVLHDQIMSSSSSSSSSTAHLHAVGAWIAAWLLIAVAVNTDNDSRTHPNIIEIRTALQSQISQCTTVLSNALSWNSANAQDAVQDLMQAHAAYLSEQADRELEKEIVNSVNRKKEPARQIARRLKEGRDAVMTRGDGEKKGKLRQDRTDFGALWEIAQNDWYAAVRPLQLALEIVANLTSAKQEVAAAAADDGDHVMEDVVVGIPDHISVLLLERQLPDKILELFRQLFSSSSSWYHGETGESVLPESIRVSVSDLQTKVAVCLSHCLSNVESWETPEYLWSDYLRAARAVDDAAQESVASAMVVALRSHSSSRSVLAQIQADDLDNLLSLLASPSSCRPALVRDVVCMLGIILCASGETRSAQVNERICKALLEVTAAGQDGSTSSSAMVIAEVLSVLMDIYGDDNCHPAIFDSLNVLGHFQRTLPVLKQKISIEELSSNASSEEIDQWKETAMNAARFIQYKKGHAA